MMSDAKSRLQQYLTNRRDELIDANRHDIANEFEIILEEFADFFSTPASGDYISKKALLEWLGELIENGMEDAKLGYAIVFETVAKSRFDLPSPSEGAAEGQYKEALERILRYAQNNKKAKHPNPMWADLVAKICEQALSPIGEQKEDAEYDYCPECNGSFSYRKPVNGKCPWCEKLLAGLEESPDA